MKETEDSFLESITSNYHSIPTLLERRDSRIHIAPWDTLDLEPLTPPTVHHIDARQVQPIERVLEAYHPGMIPKNSDNQIYPIDNYKRGDIGGVDTHTGSLELDLEEEFSPVTTLFFQYAHNSHESFDTAGNLLSDNDGVANVFLQPDGRIQGVIMLPDATSPALYYTFAPDPIRANELAYPQNVNETLLQMREVYSHIDPKHLPLISNLGRMVTAVADMWLDRESKGNDKIETLLKISGDINRYTVGKNSGERSGTEFVKVPLGGDLLSGLVAEDLIPEKIEVIELERYEEFLKSALMHGYKIPPLFRSHEMGLYFSESSPFDDGVSGSHMREILGYNGMEDVSRGLIVPSEWPTAYKGSWNDPLSFLKHQMLLATYEDLPDEVRTEMIERCNELVDNSVYLRNHTFLSTEVPALDAVTPYAFKNYSREQQERILGGFIAGILTINKDLFPYWAGPQLHGDGDSRLDWVPEGVADMLEEHGFYVSQAPSSIVHPLHVRGFNRDGTLDVMDRPFANPDLRIDDSGVIFNSKM
jgi:hypothetical protein